MAKRGRKPLNKKKGYFYEEQENAVVTYLTTNDELLKQQLFLEKIWPAITKMVESIIRRYKLYIPDESYEDTYNDTLSFLFTKLDKFEPGKYKAYSYYGTICKNYLIGKKQKFIKLQERNPLYAVVKQQVKNISYSNIDEIFDINIANETIKKLIPRLKKMVENKDIIPLKDSETKLGLALINLFENWDYILSTDGSPKLNKSAVLLFLKDSTGLDAKGIRDNIKKFKKEFTIIKGELTNSF